MHTDQVRDKEEYVLFSAFLLDLCGPHCGAIAVGLLLYRCHGDEAGVWPRSLLRLRVFIFRRTPLGLFDTAEACKPELGVLCCARLQSSV